MKTFGKFRSIRKIAVTIAALGLTAASFVTAQDRELVIAQGIDTLGFDIHNHSTSAVEAIHINIFDYLLMRDANGELQPALATEWEQVSDTAMRFRLREGVTFHDGTPFTAADVKYSLERVATDTSLHQHAFYITIDSVEIVDDHEVIIHTNEIDPILLNRLSRIGSGIVPKAYLEEVGWETFSVQPIGTGPFQFVEWRRDDRLILEAFDDHWRGRPVWDRLIHRTIPEDSTRVGELLTGGVHIATNIPEQDVARIDASANADTAPWPTFRVMQFFVNMQEGKPASDARVREALNLAIDNQMIVDTVMGGLGVPTRGSVAPGLNAVPMDLYDTYSYDPERAMELLAEAGYGPGELTITLQGPAGRYPLDVEIAEITAIMLEMVGINVEIDVLEWSAYQSRVWDVENIEDIALIGYANSLQDGYHALHRAQCGHEFSRKTGWCDDRFDELVQLSERTTDPAEREAQLAEAFHLLADSNSILFLFQLQNVAGVSNSIDWQPRPDEQLWMFDAQPRE